MQSNEWYDSFSIGLNQQDSLSFFKSNFPFVTESLFWLDGSFMSAINLKPFDFVIFLANEVYSQCH